MPLPFQALASGGLSRALQVGALLSSLGQLQTVFGDCALLLPPHANWKFAHVFRKILMYCFIFLYCHYNSLHTLNFISVQTESNWGDFIVRV